MPNFAKGIIESEVVDSVTSALGNETSIARSLLVDASKVLFDSHAQKAADILTSATDYLLDYRNEIKHQMTDIMVDIYKGEATDSEIEEWGYLQQQSDDIETYLTRPEKYTEEIFETCEGVRMEKAWESAFEEQGLEYNREDYEQEEISE